MKLLRVPILMLFLALVSCVTSIPLQRLTNTQDLTLVQSGFQSNTPKPNSSKTIQARWTERAITKNAQDLNYTSTANARETIWALTPTKPSTLTASPIPPYPAKEVLFDYSISGGHSVYDSYFVNMFRATPLLVLYSDGQMIISGKTYEQKILSPREINQFFSELETLGFYTIESNQRHDSTDKLYDFGNKYQGIYDGSSYCISVNIKKARELCAYEPSREFLIPKMKGILAFLDNYLPEDSEPYYPDRILLWIQSGRDPYGDKLPLDAISWPETLPSLETSSEKIIYVDGNAAREIYSLFDDTTLGKVFSQHGMEYTVRIEIILPHEEITNISQ